MGLLVCSGSDTEKVKHLFFFIASVSSRIDANSGEFTPFSPAFDGEGRDSQDLGYLADSQ